MLLQPEINGGSNSDMADILRNNGVYLPAGVELPAQINIGDERRSGASAADIRGAGEIQRARGGKDGVLVMERSIWRDVEMEFSVALASELQRDNRKYPTVYIEYGVILFCGVRNGAGSERANGAGDNVRAIHSV